MARLNLLDATIIYRKNVAWLDLTAVSLIEHWVMNFIYDKPFPTDISQKPRETKADSAAPETRRDKAGM